MALAGLLYCIISGAAYIWIIITGCIFIIGLCLAVSGWSVYFKRGGNKKAEFDEDFANLDPDMQRHINNINGKEHRKLLIKANLSAPFISFVFAAPFIGTALIIPIMEAVSVDGDGKVDTIKLVFALFCFAYFIGFIIIGLVTGGFSGRAKKTKRESLASADGIVYSSILKSESNFGETYNKTYRLEIVVKEVNNFLTAIVKNAFYDKGASVRVEYDKNNPDRCKIINET